MNDNDVIDIDITNARAREREQDTHIHREQKKMHANVEWTANSHRWNETKRKRKRKRKCVERRKQRLGIQNWGDWKTRQKIKHCIKITTIERIWLCIRVRVLDVRAYWCECVSVLRLIFIRGSLNVSNRKTKIMHIFKLLYRIWLLLLFGVVSIFFLLSLSLSLLCRADIGFRYHLNTTRLENREGQRH